MKTISYLCECGKSNLIETKKRPNPAVPIFFFCGGCGKPNYDFCTKCGHQSPIEYKNQFCIRCGASDLEIKKGTPCVDTFGILNHAILPFIGVLIAILTFLSASLNKYGDLLANLYTKETNRPALSTLGILTLIFLFHFHSGRLMIAPLVIALEALITGRKTPSLNARVIAQWFYCRDNPDKSAENVLSQQALKIRTLVRWLVRKLRRRIQQRNNPADYAPEGDSPSTDGLPISDHRE